MNIRFALPLVFCAVGIVTYAQTPDTSAPKADNTAVNKRDRNDDQATADQQKANASDRKLTARIRRSIVADKALSTDAHNIKIISQNGAVTLKGPVKSEDEKAAVLAKAQAVLGSADNITDEISVTK